MNSVELDPFIDLDMVGDNQGYKSISELSQELESVFNDSTSRYIQRDYMSMDSKCTWKAMFTFIINSANLMYFVLVIGSIARYNLLNGQMALINNIVRLFSKNEDALLSILTEITEVPLYSF